MSDLDKATRYTPDGLSAKLEQLDYAYQPQQAPRDRPHMFTYHLTIQNLSTIRVQILARKWILTYQNGEMDVIEGDRVVGKTPVLEPGQAFSYASFHLIADDALAHGAFHGMDGDGRAVTVPIPGFAMHVPREVS